METKVRMLIDNIIELYSNLNGKVINIHNEIKDKINPCIEISADFTKISTPNFNFDKKQIFLSEYYLNFLWIYTYFSFVYQEKSNEIQIKCPEIEVLPVSDKTVRKLLDVYKYLDKMIEKYSEWPKNIPSPNDQDIANDTDDGFWVSRTNSIFRYAVVFLLYHELGHFVLNHFEEAVLLKKIKNNQINESSEIRSRIIIAETEADNFALGLMLDIHDNDNEKVNKSYGIMTALCSSLFLLKTVEHLESNYRPSMHDRISRAMQTLADNYVLDLDYFYHYSSQMIMLFLNNFNIDLCDYNAKDDLKGYFNNLLNFLDEIISKIE
jgi:hypothetical protein